MSHDHVNELTTLMGHNVLRRVLDRVKSFYPSWYWIIADEASDVVYNEQFNLSVRYVDANYDVHEDSVGLFQLPSTDAAIIVSSKISSFVSPFHSHCRGQAYDGAAAMQGERSGVSTCINTSSRVSTLFCSCFVFRMLVGELQLFAMPWMWSEKLSN